MQSMTLLSTGEFAQLCNVSRELLVHYDKIGLLKPQEIAENGYRYYSLRQLYLFDAIKFFMDTGMSMKEIKEYLANRSTELFIDTTQDSVKQMEAQRDILNARIGMMEKMRYITQRALLFPKGQARLSYWDEMPLIITKVDPDQSEQAYAETFSDHSTFCRSVAGVSTFPFGRVINIESKENLESLSCEKLITWITPPRNILFLRERTERRPRGNYAVILHQGGSSTIERSYEKLFHYMKKEGFEALSPAYELDMHSYLMSEAPEDYLIHISILVEA